MSRLYPCVYCTEDGYCKKFSDEEVKSWCVQGPCEDEKPSNADRIRAMTDEELAEFLDRWELKDIDYSKTFCNLCKGQYDCHNDCLMEWLKKEVDDG